MTAYWLETATWPEIDDWFKRGLTVVVPVSAICKAHGYHLPMNTDWLIGRDLVRRIGEQTDVLVAPNVGFGYYNAFVEFPGSLHISGETMADLVRQLIRGLHRQGARRCLILNLGLSTEYALNLAAGDLTDQDGIPVALAHIRLLGQTARARVLENRVGTHANEGETSMVLAIDPSVVRMELARPEIQPWMHERSPIMERTPLRRDPARARTGLGKLSPSSVIGDPTRATAEKGEAILAEMAAEVVAFLREWDT